MGSCKVPINENDITPEWIYEATGLQPLENTVKVTANIQDGVGFLSNLCRVSFQTKSGNKNILVKLLPSDPEFRALTIGQYFDEREINAYTLVLPEILTVAPALEQNLCKFYCGGVEKRTGPDCSDEHISMLILEDLKPAGYQMYNPESDNWEENLQKLLTFLAQFHFSGLALENSKEEKISELFPFCLGVNNQDNGNDLSSYASLFQLAHVNFQKLLPFLKDNQASDDLYKSYERLGNHIDEVFTKILSHGGDFACLLHGDVWPPNVMIAEDSGLPVKVIDWQILSYRDPSFELSVGLLTCLPFKELSVENIEKFTKMYYQSFVDAAGSSLLENQKRSWEDLLKFFNEWAMSYAFMWFLLSIDSFPNDAKRLFKVFEMLHEKYHVSDLLLDGLDAN